MDYSERLRQLSIDASGSDLTPEPTAQPPVLDARSRSLVCLGALVAMSAPASSIQRGVDEAVSAGAAATEVVDVLDAIVPIVGKPRVVAAASRVARALDVDLFEA